jgi:hypothetical protein
MNRVHSEIADFIALGTNPTTLVGYPVSERAKLYVADLIRREKTTGLSAEETVELDRCLALEHFVRMAKTQ